MPKILSLNAPSPKTKAPKARLHIDIQGAEVQLLSDPRVQAVLRLARTIGLGLGVQG